LLYQWQWNRIEDNARNQWLGLAKQHVRRFNKTQKIYLLKCLHQKSNHLFLQDQDVKKCLGEILELHNFGICDSLMRKYHETADHINLETRQTNLVKFFTLKRDSSYFS